MELPLLTWFLSVIDLSLSSSIFPKTFGKEVGEYSWANRGLYRPCGNHHGSSHHGNTLQLLHERTRLLMKSRYLLTKLEDLELVSMDCSGQSLTTLPLPYSLSDCHNSTQVKEMYFILMNLFVHFKFMAEDWKSPTLCHDQFYSRDLSRSFERDSIYFKRILCHMIVPFEGEEASLGRMNENPRNPPELITPLIESILRREFYHYHSCSSRYARDCLVTEYAQNVLRSIIHTCSSSPINV